MNISFLKIIALVILIFTGCDKTADNEKNENKILLSIKDDQHVTKCENPYSKQEEYLMQNRGHASYSADMNEYQVHLNWEYYKKFAGSLPTDIHSDAAKTHTATSAKTIDDLGYMEQRVYWAKDLDTVTIQGAQVPTVSNNNVPFCIFKQRLIFAEESETGINQPFKLNVSNKIKCIIGFHNFDGQIINTQNSTNLSNPIVLEPGTHSLLVQD